MRPVLGKTKTVGKAPRSIGILGEIAGYCMAAERTPSQQGICPGKTDFTGR
ncbi:MAG: hypothetical protein ABSC61_09170 [Anaerolineales bacterium]